MKRFINHHKLISPPIQNSTFKIQHSTFPFLSLLRSLTPSPLRFIAPSSLRPLAFSLLLALAPFSLPAQQQWTEPVNISNMPNHLNQAADMEIDNNGVIHIVWSMKISSWYWKIMYSYSEDDGQTWSEPLDLLQNTDLWMYQPHIACDSKNNLYVTYDYATGTSDKMIYLIIFDGYQWSEPVLISEGMPGSHYNYVLIDQNNRVYVFWDHGSSGDDFYRYFENNIWSDPYCPYPGNNEIYALIEAEINDNNSMHWIGGSASTTYYGERLQYFYYDYSYNTWYPPEKPVNDTITVGLDITLNYNDFPECTYRKKSLSPLYLTSDSTIYLNREDNYWSGPNLVAGTDGYQKYQKIAVDQNNTVHIIEAEEINTGLRMVHYQKINDQWVGYIIDSTTNFCNPSQLLFHRDKLYLVYFKDSIPGTPDDDIFFTKYDIITTIKKENTPLPELKIYPNPSRGSIYIEFENNKKQHIDLSVFDMTGKHIITLINETKPPGKYRQLWKVTDKYRKEDAPHLYLVRLISGRNTVTRTVEIIK